MVGGPDWRELNNCTCGSAAADKSANPATRGDCIGSADGGELNVRTSFGPAEENATCDRIGSSPRDSPAVPDCTGSSTSKDFPTGRITAQVVSCGDRRESNVGTSSGAPEDRTARFTSNPWSGYRRG